MAGELAQLNARRGTAVDDETLKLGLLVETAETHQQLVSALLEKLGQHTQGLDAAVRQEIRRALLEELQGVRAESQRAVDALQSVQRAAHLQVVFWSVGITAMCAAVALAIAWWVLPNPGEIASLRAEREALAGNIQTLNQHGAQAELRHCGAQHLCVRVDPKLGRYGEGRDYYVIKGY